MVNKNERFHTKSIWKYSKHFAMQLFSTLYQKKEKAFYIPDYAYLLIDIAIIIRDEY